MNKRGLAILGSTGSIGRQALDIVKEQRDSFEIELLTANNSYELLIKQAIEFQAKNVVICNKEHYSVVKDALKNTDTKVYSGMSAVCELVKAKEVDIVLTAMVGFSGLRSTIAAIEAKKVIALANKETLVAAGELVMDMAIKEEAYIIPVDSEHSAIFQCIMGAHNNKIAKIHLTASGGPFRELSKEKIAISRSEEALKHPKWNMGKKISIDSATMMNKGFEMIEAKWLFNVEPKDINILVHPQSIIHSMVEYQDGSIIAQLGTTDMRLAISFALCFPERRANSVKKFDPLACGKLEFFAVDHEKFPALDLAFKAIERGGNLPCIMNAANEAAVAAYLENKIRFYDISEIIAMCMEEVKFIEKPNLYNIFDSNNLAYEYAKELINKRTS